MRVTSARSLVPFIASLMLLSAAAAMAETKTDDVQARTERARNGAGLRVGEWDVQGVPTGAGTSHTPAFEGYFQKGLDVHLVWESTIGYWGHTYTATQSGPLGSSTSKVQTHLIPTMTALKLYPLTTRKNPFEPYMLGGLGVVMGIVQDQGSTGVTSGPGTNLDTGLGIATGGGFDWRWNEALGMTAGGRYQWATFSQSVGPRALYRGPAFNAGLTYRFQYEK